MCAYHASVPALTGVRLTWSRAHARRHGHVSFRASRCRAGHGAAAIGERRYARDSLLPQRARFYRVCATKVVRHAGGRLEDLGGPRARMRDACMQTGWRSRPRHPSAGPGVKTGAPRVRVPPDAAGPGVNAHRFLQGPSAINDSFECVQKRSHAGIDNLYKALSSDLTLIITLTNVFPRASAVGRGAGLEWRSCGWARGGRGLSGAAGDARRAAGTEGCSARPVARASARSGPDLVETRPKLLRWWHVASRRF